jgi:hypothetical protein
MPNGPAPRARSQELLRSPNDVHMKPSTEGVGVLGTASDHYCNATYSAHVSQKERAVIPSFSLQACVCFFSGSHREAVLEAVGV